MKKQTLTRKKKGERGTGVERAIGKGKYEGKWLMKLGFGLKIKNIGQAYEGGRG